MNINPRTLQTIAITVSLIGFSAAIQVQPSQAKPIASTLLNETKATENLQLLELALANFLPSDRRETNSEIQFKIAKNNEILAIRTHNKTFSFSNGRFRSQITTLASNRSSDKKYTVISDGKRTWIYNENSQQYSSLKFEDFQSSEQMLWLGLSSMFDSLENKEIKTILATSKMRSTTSNIDGKNYYIYDYQDPNNSSSVITFFVEPKTASIQYLNFALRHKDLKLTIEETIISRTSSPIVTEEIFTFSPPLAAKKIKVMNIMPF